MELRRETDCNYLRYCHPSVAEHPDLIGDVFPVTGRSLFLQTITEFLTNGNDPVGHPLNVVQPAKYKQ